ncbi:MAG: hypothetical protein M5U19_16835 [Microthrixaceae bacterium]|nr:hypothetical protein [Microthrixaceae bacterium]
MTLPPGEQRRVSEPGAAKGGGLPGSVSCPEVCSGSALGSRALGSGGLANRLLSIEQRVGEGAAARAALRATDLLVAITWVANFAWLSMISLGVGISDPKGDRRDLHSVGHEADDAVDGLGDRLLDAREQLDDLLLDFADSVENLRAHACS